MSAIHARRCATALMFALPAAAGGSGPEAQSTELAEVLQLLRARDEALSRLYLPFAAHAVAVDGSRSAQPDHVGWFARDGRRTAACSVRSTGGAQLEFAHAVFDGARVHGITGRGRIAVDTNLPLLEAGSPVIEARAEGRFARPLDAAELPINLGLAHATVPWSQYLDERSDLTWLGEATIGGRKCAEIVFDMTTAKVDDGVYDAPFTLAVDVESLLVLRAEVWLPRDRTPASVDAQALEPRKREFAGREMFPTMAWTVEEQRRVGDFWLPSRGSLSHPSAYGLASVEVSVDLERAIVNADLPTGCLVIEAPPGAATDDQVRGRFEDPFAADARAASLDASYRASIGVLALGAGLAPALPAARVDLDGAGCGPRALLAVAHLLGRDLALDEVLHRLPAGSGAEGETSLLGIAVVARELGFQPRPARASIEMLEGLRTPCILHLPLDSGRSGHFAVALATAREIAVFDPPASLRTTSAAELLAQGADGALVFEGLGDASPERASSLWSLVRGAQIVSGALLAWLSFGLARNAIRARRVAAPRG